MALNLFFTFSNILEYNELWEEKKSLTVLFSLYSGLETVFRLKYKKEEVETFLFFQVAVLLKQQTNNLDTPLGLIQ